MERVVIEQQISDDVEIEFKTIGLQGDGNCDLYVEGKDKKEKDQHQNDNNTTELHNEEEIEVQIGKDRRIRVWEAKVCKLGMVDIFTVAKEKLKKKNKSN